MTKVCWCGDITDLSNFQKEGKQLKGVERKLH